MKTSTIALVIFVGLLVIGMIVRSITAYNNPDLQTFLFGGSLSNVVIFLGSIIGIETTIIYKVRFKNSDSTLAKKLMLVCGGIILGLGAEILVDVGAQAIATELEPHNPCMDCFPYAGIGGLLEAIIAGIVMFPVGLFIVLSSSKR